MSRVDLWVVKGLRLLPRRFAEDALGQYFLFRFRGRRPCMVEEVTFYDCEAALGIPPDPVVVSWGFKSWGLVTRFEGEPFWLEESEAEDHIAKALERLASSEEPVRELVIDRSRIKGYGDPECMHPAYHASYSLWTRLKDDKMALIASCEHVKSKARISGWAILYDLEGL